METEKRSVDARMGSKGLYRWNTDNLHHSENTLCDTIMINIYHRVFTRLIEGTTYKVNYNVSYEL